MGNALGLRNQTVVKTFSHTSAAAVWFCITTSLCIGTLASTRTLFTNNTVILNKMKWYSQFNTEGTRLIKNHNRAEEQWNEKRIYSQYRVK